MVLLIYSFWFAPKCESVADCIHMGLYTVILFWFSPLCESVMDCIHILEPQPVPSLLPPRETLKEARDDLSFDDN